MVIIDQILKIEIFTSSERGKHGDHDSVKINYLN